MKTLFCVLTLACSAFPAFSNPNATPNANQQPEKNKPTHQELVDLTLKFQAALELQKATGLGPNHPKILRLEKTLAHLNAQLKATPAPQDTIIFIEGKTSTHLIGHEDAGKNKNVLPALLKDGWKVQKLISTGENSAYVWLRK